MKACNKQKRAFLQMSWGSVFLVTFVSCISSIEAKENAFTGKEPDPSLLMAPLYPNVIFIRTMDALDPNYEIVIYVTPDTTDKVVAFFSKQLQEKNTTTYQQRNSLVTVFLLRDDPLITPARIEEDFTLLDQTPNIQVELYQKFLYEPLIVLLKTKLNSYREARALENAKTLIRYTYPRTKENVDFIRILGAWKNTDRDLNIFYKSTITFNEDKTYSLLLTQDNVTALADSASSLCPLDVLDKDKIKNLKERNPEKGKFSLLRQSIVLTTEKPLVDKRAKDGTVKVGPSTLSLEFKGKPRLTFIRIKPDQK
jgi:hypothetical protein